MYTIFSCLVVRYSRHEFLNLGLVLLDTYQRTCNFEGTSEEIRGFPYR